MLGVAVSTPSTSYTLLISSKPTPLLAMVSAAPGAGAASTKIGGAGVLGCRMIGSMTIVPTSALNSGDKVPLSRSYTHSVYCGGASVTLAPAVFDELQRSVVFGVTVVSSTKQGDQLTSRRLVPSYNGNTEANLPPSEGMSASVVTPSVVALACAVPAAPPGVAG